MRVRSPHLTRSRLRMKYTSRPGNRPNVHVHTEAIKLNDLGHEAIVQAISGSLPTDQDLRDLLMRALEQAETIAAHNPKAQAEQVIALVNLDLFSVLTKDEGRWAYTRAIQDALDATGKAFDGTPSNPVEVSRLAHVWYMLGFQQQAIGQFSEAVGLYQLASQTAMAVPEGQRDVRLLVLVATNTAACADRLGMPELADRTRKHVEVLLTLLEEG